MRNLALALFLSTAIAACGNHGHNASSTDSPLDKILVIGKNTRGEWQQFMKNGGLQANDQWRGYTVQNVSLGYDGQDRLSEISLVLTSGVNKRTPTLPHISQDLAGLCGSDWRKGTPAMAKNGKIICIYSPNKTNTYYRLEISKMEGNAVNQPFGMH